MSEPVTKQRPTVDLDDFEREMREAHSSYHHDDPLAELARLVGEQSDPYRDVFAREAQAPANAGSLAHDRDERRHQGEGYQSRREPAFETAPAALSPRLTGDFAAIEAGLRGQSAQAPYAPSAGQAYAQGYEYGEAHDHGAQGDADPHGYVEPTAYNQGWAQSDAASRSRRPLYLMVATIAVGLVGIGAAYALKGHIGTSPREVKTILADTGPTKVQPPAEAAAGDQSQDPAMTGQNQTAPTALVNREEQPVDVTQAVQDNAARAHRTDAASVPVPPSPGQVQVPTLYPAGLVQGFPAADMPAPKRVRVVSVRPDGTILPGDDAASTNPPASAPVKTADRPGVASKAAPKASPTKTTSRVTTPKTIDQLAGAPDADAPAAPASKAKKPKPQRVAAIDPAEPANPVAAPAAASGAGGWAVQLAAPRTEADARAASSKLAKQFAGPLAGHQLGFHKADSNGKSVYRIRVGSLSKADASSLCEKLQAGGGTCFVAKN